MRSSRSPPPAPQQRNPVCVRLESQLRWSTAGQVDPQRAEQIKRYEETAQRQQAELDRLTAQAGAWAAKAAASSRCSAASRSNAARSTTRSSRCARTSTACSADLQRLQGNTADREGERRTILASLGQNDCGPQYKQYANRGGGGFFENLFGGGTIITPGDAAARRRAATPIARVCVRTCDGYYFPISYSTTPASFPQDEQVCQRMCPAAEVALYSHRNPGEDIAQAISTGGRNYSELPNAFAFRKAFKPSCSCRAPGQTWAAGAQAPRRQHHRARRHRRDRGAGEAAVAAGGQRGKGGRPRARARSRKAPAPAQTPTPTPPKQRPAKASPRCAPSARPSFRRTDAAPHTLNGRITLRRHHSVMCMMNLSRFGIFTLGKVLASMTSVSPTIPLMWSRYAVRRRSRRG